METGQYLCPLSILLTSSHFKITVVSENYSVDYKEIEDAFKRDIENYNKQFQEKPKDQINIRKIYSIPHDYVTLETDKIIEGMRAGLWQIL